ncbi:MAG TPA: PIN domain-containing protein [Anaerolineae bacterium]
MAQTYLLDTHVITGILKRDAKVAGRLRRALDADARIVISPVVYYETRRGLLKRDAKKQLGFFEQLAETFHWDDLLRPDWETASEWWASETGQGRPPQDADLLIAVQARRLTAVLVTDNERHFDHFNLTTENWLA